MDEARVYVKTTAGQAEVSARSGLLTLAMRRVLIMIDGKRTVGELAPLLRPGEIDAAIQALIDKGFIELAGAPPQAAPPRPPSISTAPATLSEMSDPGRYLSIDEARRRVVRELLERLGPEADYLAVKIERCASVDELRERIREAEHLLANAIGAKAAQEFRQALRRR